jgi:hypothetical protein
MPRQARTQAFVRSAIWDAAIDLFAPAPEIAYQRHIQIRTRWFEVVERVMSRAK